MHAHKHIKHTHNIKSITGVGTLLVCKLADRQKIALSKEVWEKRRKEGKKGIKTEAIKQEEMEDQE